MEIDEPPGSPTTPEEKPSDGLKIAIVSSREWVDRHLIRLERAEHFDEIVTADRDPERLGRARPCISRRSTVSA